MRSGRDLDPVEPDNDALRSQVTHERHISHAHLRSIIDGYWEPQWRRRLSGDEAEEYLWRAAAALIEIDDALAGPDS